MSSLYTVSPDGQMTVGLHEGQLRAWNSRRRIVAIVAGSQGGKTSFAPLWLWREIQDCGPGDYGFVAPTYKLLELKALPEFRRLFEATLRLGTYLQSPVQRFVFSDSGARRTFGYKPDVATVVYFGHAQNPDSLESATYKGVVLDEAGQAAFKRGSYEAIRRRVALNQGRILLGTTPYFGHGWLQTEIIDKAKAGDPEIELIQFASTMNPAFPLSEFEWARNNLPFWRFAMMYLGQTMRPPGLIYDSFKPGIHKVPRFAIPDNWPRYLGLDFGGVNTAAVLLARDPKSKRLYIYREYHGGNLTAAGHTLILLADEPMIPTSVGGSFSEGQWRDEFRAAGLPVRKPDQSDVEVGVSRVWGAFNTDALYVFDDLPGLLGELDIYQRVVDDEGNVTEEIENKNQFHRLDALRYIVGWLRRNANAKMKTAKVDLYAKIEESTATAKNAQIRTDDEVERLLDADE